MAGIGNSYVVIKYVVWLCCGSTSNVYDDMKTINFQCNLKNLCTYRNLERKPEVIFTANWLLIYHDRVVMKTVNDVKKNG